MQVRVLSRAPIKRDFPLEASPGNVAAADFDFIKKQPAVKLAIPYSRDNLSYFRMIGTAMKAKYAPLNRVKSGPLYFLNNRLSKVNSIFGITPKKHLPYSY